MMLLLSLLLSFGAEARVCEDLRLPVSKSIDAPDGVSYFMRGSDKRTVGFATSSGNRLLNVNNGKYENFPGEIDPVPTPDGALIAAPVNIPITRDGVSGVESRMHFYRESAPGKYELVFMDPKVSENYQSLGVLNSSPGETSYRMLYQSGSEIYAREYSYDRKAKKLTPGPDPKLACSQNLGRVSLPMLSKNGKEFSYYDYDQKKTLIYEIKGIGNKCELKDEIPALVGKMDFSPDGRRTVFHADGAMDGTNTFDHPDPSYGLGIYLYDRATKRVLPLHVSRTEDAYYPIFLNEEEIAFVSANKGGDPEKRKFAVRLASIKQAGKGCAACYKDEVTRRAGAVIGYFYGRACRGQAEYQPGAALVSFMSLDADRCRELVRGTSVGQIKEFINKNYTSAEAAPILEKDKLNEACAALAGIPAAKRSAPLEAPAGAQSAH